MQLALTPEVLIAAGAAVLVLVIALAVALVVRRRRGARPEPGPAAVGPPGEQTWQEPPGRTGDETGSVNQAGSGDQAGSGRTVAAAVAQALATREARGLGGTAAGGRGDARDRLLAVLLADPVRAVGAAVELESCRRQLDRLTGALEHERATLRDVLARLAAAGLSPDQLARLSGLSDGELQPLMPERASVG